MTLFVGRRRELSALDASLLEASRGQGTCVLVSGEAGIGKSRLIAEARKCATRRGFVQLGAVCQEQDRFIALAPLMALLRHDVLLLPEGTQQTDLRAATQILTQFAEQRPLLVTIEDVHWSDDASQRWLLDFITRILGRRVLLLLSFRTPAADYDLEPFVRIAEAHEHVRHLRLQPWSRQEVEAVMRALSGAKRSIRFYYLAKVFDVTRGNPLFVEELCISSTATETVSSETDLLGLHPLPQVSIPRSVRRIIGQRVQAVSRSAQRVANLSAVHRRAFDFELLEAITEFSWWHLQQLCQELVAAQLVAEEADGRWSFRHAMVREALHDRLLRRERRALHRRLVAGIEVVYENALEEHLADLSYHAYEAGCWRRALKYAQLAGEQALLLDAPEAAAAQFSRAIEAGTRLPETPTWQLHCQRARAFTLLGKIDGALTDYATALDSVRVLEDVEGERAVIEALSRLLPSLEMAYTNEYYRKIMRPARGIQGVSI